MHACSVAGLTPTNNPLDFAGLISILATVDLAGYFSPHPLLHGDKRHLRELLGVPVSIKPNKWWKYGRDVRIPRLTTVAQLVDLEAWARPKGLYLSWLDIAFDFRFASGEQASAAYQYLKVHLVIPRGARGTEPLTYDTSRYAVDFNSPGRGKSRGKRPARNFDLYWKDEMTLRVELRFFRAGAIKRYFQSLPQIMDIDPEVIFHQHFRLQVPSEPFLRKQVAIGEAIHIRSVLRRRGRRVRGGRTFDPVRCDRTLRATLNHMIYLIPQKVRDACTLKPLALDVPIEWARG